MSQLYNLGNCNISKQRFFSSKTRKSHCVYTIDLKTYFVFSPERYQSGTHEYAIKANVNSNM